MILSQTKSSTPRWRVMFLASALATMLILPCAASAGTTNTPSSGEDEEGGRPSVGLIETVNSEAGRESGVAASGTVSVLVGRAINAVLGFVGVLFFVLMIYAGFLWMTASGNEESVTRAKNILTTSVIGLVVVIGAYYILDFVLNAIYGTLEG